MTKLFSSIAAIAAIGFLATSSAALAGNNAHKLDGRTIHGPNYASPYAQAIAYVGQAGVVIGKKGFSAITHPSVGIYCLEQSAAATLVTEPIVTVEWGRSLGVALFAQYNYFNSSCPAPTNRTIEVRTYKGDTSGVGSDLQIPVLSDQVAFIVMVP
jgi:hypothetical protein